MHQLYSQSALSLCHPGQSHLRSEDRFRHITNERTRVPSVYPVKRKRSHDRGLTLEERLVDSTFKRLLIRLNIHNIQGLTAALSTCSRRERALSRSSGKAAQMAATAPVNTPQSPTSTWSPTASPTSPTPTHVCYPPVVDEPIALIKKPRKETDGAEEKTKSPASPQIQVISV